MTSQAEFIRSATELIGRLETATLTCGRLPNIVIGGLSPRPGSAEWLAALWQFVSHAVKAVNIDHGRSFWIQFDNGELQVDLSPSDNALMENATLHFETGEMIVM